MKKIGCLLLLLLLFSSCLKKSGTTGNVTVTLGDSTRFSQEELEAAADCVIKKFSDFSGCDLLTIVYDEEWSDRWVKTYAGLDPDNALVLHSSFYVDGSGADNGFNPNDTYSGWNWYLERDSKEGSWKMFSYGYA